MHSSLPRGSCEAHVLRSAPSPSTEPLHLHASRHLRFGALVGGKSRVDSMEMTLKGLDLNLGHAGFSPDFVSLPTK